MFAAALIVLIADAPDAELQKQLAAIGKQLASKKPKEVVAALEDAGKLGEKAAPLQRKIVELVLGKNDDVAGAAADALKEVNPKIHDVSLSLRTAANDNKAFEIIGGAGENALPLAWIIHERLKALAAVKSTGAGNEPKATIARGFKALQQIGDTSDAHWNLALRFQALETGAASTSYHWFVDMGGDKRVYHIKTFIIKSQAYTVSNIEDIASIGKEGKDALPKLRSMAKLAATKELRDAAATAVEVIEKALKD